MVLSVSAAGRETNPSETVIDEVAAREGVDPLDLERPLFESIDPEALDSLVESAVERPGRSPVEIEFSYAGYDVTVTSDGSVDVSERT